MLPFSLFPIVVCELTTIHLTVAKTERCLAPRASSEDFLRPVVPESLYGYLFQVSFEVFSLILPSGRISPESEST